jgi:hypothetical protein
MVKLDSFLPLIGNSLGTGMLLLLWLSHLLVSSLTAVVASEVQKTVAVQPQQQQQQRELMRIPAMTQTTNQPCF